MNEAAPDQAVEGKSLAEESEATSGDPKDRGNRSDFHEIDPRYQFLRELPLLKPIANDSSCLRELAAASHVRLLKAEETIFEEGDQGHDVFVVMFGVVEVVLHQAPYEAIVLCNVKRHELLGEMALVDGGPRSATARAITDCQVLQVDGRALRAGLPPSAYPAILRAVVHRVRHSDRRIVEYYRKVARAGQHDAQAAVTMELESIKTLYQRTAEVAEECMRRATHNVDDVKQKITAGYDFLLKVVAPVTTALVAVLGVVGYWGLDNLREKHQEVTGYYDDIKTSHTDVRSRAHDLRVLGQTMIGLRSAREAAEMRSTIYRPEELKWAALNNRRARRELMRLYVWSKTAGARYPDLEGEVVLEAVVAFVSLTVREPKTGLLELDHDHGEAKKLLGALAHVVRNVTPDRFSTWHRAQLLDVTRLLIRSAKPDDRAFVRTELEEVLRWAPHPESKQLAAQMMADLTLGTKVSKEAQRVLGAVASYDSKSWVYVRNNLALAKLGDSAAWRRLTTRLSGGFQTQRDMSSGLKDAYAAAVILAEERFDQLPNLLQRFECQGEGKECGPCCKQFVAKLDTVLQSRATRNCHEKRYLVWLQGYLQHNYQPWLLREAMQTPCDDQERPLVSLNACTAPQP